MGNDLKRTREILTQRLQREPTLGEMMQEVEDEKARTSAPLRITIQEKEAPVSPIDAAWAEQERLLIEQATHMIHTHMTHQRTTCAKNLVPVVEGLNVRFSVNLLKGGE